MCWRLTSTWSLPENLRYGTHFDLLRDWGESFPAKTWPDWSSWFSCGRDRRDRREGTKWDKDGQRVSWLWEELLILDSSSFSKDYQEDFKNLSVQNRSATVSRSIKHFAIETCAAMDLASLAPNLPVLMTCQASNTGKWGWQNHETLGLTGAHWGSLYPSRSK